VIKCFQTNSNFVALSRGFLELFSFGAKLLNNLRDGACAGWNGRANREQPLLNATGGSTSLQLTLSPGITISPRRQMHVAVPWCGNKTGR
jgi:hypothetical protein